MELIKIEQRNGIETVNARDLHLELKVGKVFAAWILERIEKYQFIDGQDFIVISEIGNNPNGGRPFKEYHISIDMAKELAMVENNEQGRKIRQYFIEVEKRARQLTESKPPTGEKLIALALVEAQRFLAQKDAQIESMKPAVQFMADVTGSRDAIEMSQVAKIIGMGYGRNKLFELLRENDVLRENNEPYQKYIDAKWFRVIEQQWKDDKGETHITIKTLVYQRGIDGIINIIRAQA